MSHKPPMLHLICGKIASGKSTLSARLGAEPGTIVISEDAWLGPLFDDQLKTGADYLRCAARLQKAMAPHVATLLGAGLSVVLDFPANTPDQRAWMLGLARTAGVDHRLHYLDVPDAVCLDRLRARNAEGLHPFAATEEQFHRFAAHFVPPAEDEGFHIVRH